MGNAVYISYLQDDVGGLGRMLWGYLANRVTGTRISLDMRGTKLPSWERASLEQQAMCADTMLVLVGSRWNDSQQPSAENDAARRVGMEVAAALERGARVIPILVDDAEMPAAKSLPQALHRITEQAPLRLRRENFSFDAQEVANVLNDGRVVPIVPGRLRQMAFGAAIILVVALAGYVLVQNNNRVSSQAPIPVTDSGPIGSDT